MSTAKCYYPDGTVTKRDTPCNPTAEQSACCLPEHSCLNNGLCLQPSGTFARGSCTDSSWKHENCAKQCQQEKRDRGASVFLCNKTATGPWGCDNTGCSSNTFLLGDVKPALRPDELSSSYTEVFGAPAATTSRNASTGQLSSQGTTYTSGQMAGVGVGVAVPLLIALSAAIWLLWVEKKKTKAMGAWELQWNAQNPQYAYESGAQKQTNQHAELAPDAERLELPAGCVERTDRIADSPGGTHSSGFQTESSPHLSGRG